MTLVSTGNLTASSLTEILCSLVHDRQTGYLRIKDGEQEGFVAVENGVIINAGAGTCVALHALFLFVGWRAARYEFQARPLAGDLTRDLAVYDPQVLIDGVAFKEEELEVLKHMTPRTPMAKAS